MKSKTLLVTAFSLLLLSSSHLNPAAADTVTIKAGYFNLAVVKSKFQASLDADAFRTQSEKDLLDEVEAGNQRLDAAKASGSSLAQQQAMADELQSKINSRQKQLIADYQAKNTAATQAIMQAATKVAEQKGLQLIVDGAAVYGGGKVLVDKGIDVTNSILNALGVASTDSSGNASPTAFDIAYFNKATVFKALPDLDVEKQRTAAETQLRTDVAEGNAKLAAAQKAGKSKQELAQMASSLQSEINAKQQALAKFIQTETAASGSRCSTLVQKVVAGRANLILEGSGVYYGKQPVTDHGTDITDLICKGGTLDSVPSTQTAIDETAQAKPVSNASTATKPDAPIRDKWAVVVGISKFANPQINLKFAAKDAQDFRDFLVKEENFKSDHIVTLLNEQATRANIMSAFGSRWLPNVAEPGDLVVVYVSTHGTPSSIDNGGRNYVVAYDTDINDLYATGVDMDELSRRIKEGVKTERALIVLDTCFSGNAGQGGKGINRVGNFDVKALPVGNGHLIISSSGMNQASWESKTDQNGIFTHYLIQALRSCNGNVNQAFDKLQSQVSWEVKRDYGAQQEPQLGGNWQGRELVISSPAGSPRPMTGVPGEQVIIPTAVKIKPPATTPKPVAH